MSEEKTEIAVALFKAAEITGAYHVRLLALTGEAMSSDITPEEIQECFKVASGVFDTAISESASNLEDVLSRAILREQAPVQTEEAKSGALDMSLQLLGKRLESFRYILSDIDDDFDFNFDQTSGTAVLLHGEDYLDDLVAAYNSDAEGNASGFLGLVSRMPSSYGRRIVVLKDGKVPGGGELFTFDEPGARAIAAAYPVVKSVYR